MAPPPPLPDLALLAVFSHLDSRQLLRVRAVSRQWRDLALSPQLWVGRDVSWEDPYAALVLLRAPCLRSLDLQREWDDALPPEVGRAALSTRCAVRELRLLVINQPAIRYAHRVLENQVALGRLRALRLLISLRTPGHCAADFEELMALVDRAGLEGLEIRNKGSTPLPARVRCELERGTTRLKQLEWMSYICNQEEPLLNSLLELHMDSLEEVHVNMEFTACGPAVVELSRCPRLRRLRLNVMLTTELAALDPRCLTYLNVHIDAPVGWSVEEAEDLVARLSPTLRRATVMEELEVSGYGPGGELVLPGLVRALASSGLSALRRLRYSSWYDDYPWDSGLEVPAQEIPSSLRLPHLRRLELWGTPPQGLVRVLSSDVALDPRDLVIDYPRCMEVVCALPWVRALKAVYPCLQVSLR